MLSRRLLRIKVVKALYARLQGGSGDLRESLERTYDLYAQMLWLVVEVKRFAEMRIEQGLKKMRPTEADLKPNLRFVENEAVRLIEESEELVDFLERRHLGWRDVPELIKAMYEALVGSRFYERYMRGVDNWDADVDVVKRFYSSVEVEESELLEEVLEEQSAMWNDDLGFALVMVVRTLERMKAGKPLTMLPRLDDEEAAFAAKLLEVAAAGYEANLALIEPFVKNWDVERLALVDTLILTTAVAEMAAFPEIPVKVTLDEYIEIAKYYSTPGSNSFINGVLDKAVEKLGREKI